MTQNIGTRVKSPLGILDVNFYSDYGTVFSGWRYYKITKVGDITVGTDKDSDIAMLPGEFEFKFYLNETTQTALAIFSDFKTAEIQCVVYINGTPIWQGYVEGDHVEFKTATKELSIKAYDLTRRLLNYKPKTNPFGYTLGGSSDYKKVIDAIYEPFSRISWFPNGIINKSTIQARNGAAYYGFADFYTRMFYYYDTDSNYNNVMSLIKQILLNYGLMLYLWLDGKVYLIPRFSEYDSGYYQIMRSDYIELPEYDVILPVKRFMTRLWNGIPPKYNSPNYEPKSYSVDDWPVDTKADEEFIIDQPGGNIIEPPADPFYWSGIWVNINGSYTIIDVTTPNFRRQLSNGSYTDYFDLWKYPTEETWNSIKVARKKCSVIVSGTYNKWKPDRFYTIQDISGIWRPAQFKFDIMHNTTEIKLREV